MKKRPRPASSSGSRSSCSRSANALVRSSMARVSSLAGGPSDEAVARLIALEVCGELDEQKRVVMGTGKCRNTNTQNCATRPNRRLPLPAEDKVQQEAPSQPPCPRSPPSTRTSWATPFAGEQVKQ